MKQFSGLWPDIVGRAAANSGLLERLVKDAQPVLQAAVRIPQSGIASWNLYYFCPRHGVRLTWRADTPYQHACPVDGEIFSGEPWDGAWWREMNGRNASACQQLGLLWRLTGETAYRDKVRTLLMGYADVYPGYAIHGDIPNNGPGKMNAQTLCEANCILEMALGYDFIRDSLPPASSGTSVKTCCAVRPRFCATIVVRRFTTMKSKSARRLAYWVSSSKMKRCWSLPLTSRTACAGSWKTACWQKGFGLKVRFTITITRCRAFSPSRSWRAAPAGACWTAPGIRRC